MQTSPLADRFGRVATDLRLSVTDVCNLRCTYCLPEKVQSWMPRDTVLSIDELARLVRIGVGLLGIRSVRLTGGEPLVRPDLVDIIGAMRHDNPDLPLALTTNGVGLAEQAEALARAGLDRVNISLDSVDRHTYAQITRRDRLERVLDGVSAAIVSGLDPVKVNAVPIRGVNDEQLVDLTAYCLRLGAELRFIEQMPIGAPRDWARANLISAEEIRGALATRYTLRTVGDRGHSPAALWEVFDGAALLGRIGIIASVTEPFCGRCDRTRISADGQLRSCLFSNIETDLRQSLRGDASDEDIAQQWAATMLVKPRAHGSVQGGFGLHFIQPQRPMNAIGG